jgi:hypothetical protein
MAAAVIHRLKRDEAALLNSTLPHELYFASLGGVVSRRRESAMLYER